MKILGTISHVSNKGNIIARSKSTPALGLPVFTENKKRIGRVHDVFGPTKEPYITIKPNRAINLEKFENQIGEVLLVSAKPVKKWGRKKRKKR